MRASLLLPSPLVGEGRKTLPFGASADEPEAADRHRQAKQIERQNVGNAASSGKPGWRFAQSPCRPVAFLDDGPQLRGARVEQFAADRRTEQQSRGNGDARQASGEQDRDDDRSEGDGGAG